MLYAMLIYEAEEVGQSYTEADEQTALRGHRALQERAKRAGHFAEALQLTPPSAASTLRVRGGEVTLVDGPFTETKELLIGLYVMECDDLEAAIAYAKSIPHAATGSVELRPVAYREAMAQA